MAKWREQPHAQIAGASDEDFERWLIEKSFSMLAVMCRVGLAVVVLMLLLVDPLLYRSGVWGQHAQHAYLVAWHASATLHFLLFLTTARLSANPAARRFTLAAFVFASAALFTWFAFISWMLSGDLSTYAIYLLTMVCVFSFPGHLRKALNLASTGALVLLIYRFDQRGTFYSSGAAINLMTLMLVALLLDEYLMRLNRDLYREKRMVEYERARADRVLYNALPVSIANELKNNNVVKAEKYQKMSILFVDIVGFTHFSSTRAPDLVVQVLNDIFSDFDSLVDRYDVEKIKTIGDAYMVVGKRKTAAIANLALDMSIAMDRYDRSHRFGLRIRTGIHVGPTVAGVIGLKRFLYDVWGDAVNTASRMESTGEPGKIQVSEDALRELDAEFRFEPRGEVEIKGKGRMRTFFLLGRKDAATLAPSMLAQIA